MAGAVGEMLIRMGEPDEAKRAFAEIVEFAPGDPWARRRLGDLYRAHGWYEESYREYETLTRLLPDDDSVLLLLAAAAAGAGRTDEALRLEERLSSARPRRRAAIRGRRAGRVCGSPCGSRGCETTLGAPARART